MTYVKFPSTNSVSEALRLSAPGLTLPPFEVQDLGCRAVGLGLMISDKGFSKRYKFGLRCTLNEP